MEKTGLPDEYLNKILEYTYLLYLGRKALHIQGQEAQGRVAYAEGISGALAIFKIIQTTQNSQIIIAGEKVYLQQDIQFCDPADKLTIKFLMRSLNYLNDALRAIEIAKSAEAYRNAEATHATEHRDRRGGVPKDVVHNACNINSARLDQNNRTPGLSMTEKDLLKQRKANLDTAKASYIKMQQLALGLPTD